jgi:hypothetical protein
MERHFSVKCYSAFGKFCSLFVCSLVVAFCCMGPSNACADTQLDLHKFEDRVVVKFAGQVIAVYRFQDPNVSHPYWSELRTLSGVQVTRNHPPREKVDALDHPGIHTGAWLAFGDVDGNDYWRLKASVKPTDLRILPIEETGGVSFQVKNQWCRSQDSSILLAETTRFRFRRVKDGYLLEWETKLEAENSDATFGEQEEMGLGIRMATSLSVDKGFGARMLDSQGRRNGKEIWGNKVEWCDYAGPIENHWCGITVLVDSKSGRECRCHARDYGFMAFNPFSTRVFTGGEPTLFVLHKGQTVALRFGVYVHQSEKEADFSVLPAKNLFDQAAP